MIWVLAGVVVVLLLVVVWLVATVRRLAQSLAATAGALEELRTQAMPLIADTRSALRKAEGANRRADALIDVATSLTGTADQAARLATKVVSSPIVKLLAFFTGIGRGLRRLVGRA
jgi:uncharacterized protein YoxC